MRRLHVDFFVELSIEVSAYNINLINLPISLSCQCQEDSDGRDLRCGGEGFVVISTLRLFVTTCDDAGFVLQDFAVRSQLHLENVTAWDDWLGLGGLDV